MTVAPQAQAQETEVVTGVIQGIVDKGNGRWQVQVDTGGQNPRGLWSRDGTLVGQLMMMVGHQQTFLCGISHWNRSDGSPVRSLWINGVGPPAQQSMQVQQPMPAQMVQQQLPQPMQQPMTVVQPQAVSMGALAQPQQRLTEEERENRIMRQTASKVAGILISHVPAEERTLDSVLKLSEQLVGYYRQGLPVLGNPGYGNDGPHPDDDIPF